MRIRSKLGFPLPPGFKFLLRIGCVSPSPSYIFSLSSFLTYYETLTVPQELDELEKVQCLPV